MDKKRDRKYQQLHPFCYGRLESLEKDPREKYQDLLARSLVHKNVFHFTYYDSK